MLKKKIPRQIGFFRFGAVLLALDEKAENDLWKTTTSSSSSSLPLGIIFTIQMGDLDELLADLKGFCKAREDGTSKTYAFTGPKKEVTSMFPQEGSVIKISN